jgi:hypothetical protein
LLTLWSPRSLGISVLSLHLLLSFENACLPKEASLLEML